MIRFACDIHPWERAFVLVMSHPFFAVSDDAGSFQIAGVPPGGYIVEAWHPHYGSKASARVLVLADTTARVDFTYDASDPEPEENRDELRDLF